MASIVKLEEGLDELLMLQNPKGGRPMGIGTPTFSKRDDDVDVTGIREETQIRYHLGYCTCSRAIKVGERRARVLYEALGRKGFRRLTPKENVRVRLVKFLMRQLVGKRDGDNPVLSHIPADLTG